MAKKKKLADRVNEKRRKAQKSKPVNPFEMHFNKRKTTVLGQNSKQEQGFPGLSRSNAIKKRKSTLLVEYKSQNKANKFIDQRIGERNADLSENDRAMARFVAHRSKEYKKKFVLDDNMDTEEILTHRGQTLNEIERFDNPNSDEDDDEDYNNPNKSGKLDAEFVREGHFGGGILTKTGVDGARTHRDLINELISESKKRKADKQKAKEQTMELTDKLNAQWEDLKPWVSNNVVIKKNEKKKADPYDMMMAKLMQEGVHAASDRLKTEDELAKEEKEKLEKLEKDRVARMRGTNLQPAPKHRSADDLDDGFVYNRNFEVMLAYDQKGKCLVDCDKLHKEGNEEEDESDDDTGRNVDESDEDEVETESEDNYSDLEEEKGSSSEDEERGVKRKRSTLEDNKADKKLKANKVDNEQKNYLNEDGDESDEEETKIEDASDEEENQKEAVSDEEEMEEEDASDEEENQKEDASDEEKKEKEDASDEEKADSEEENDTADEETNGDKIVAMANDEKNTEAEVESIINEVDKQESMNKAKEELPFTFEIPDSYEDFQKFFVNRTVEDHGLIMERMIKCNHPKLANENKDKMDTLFVYLLQYVNDISCDFPVDKCFKILGTLLPNLFDVAQMNQNNAPKAIIEVITEKQLDYRQNKKRYPDVDVLFFLKIVSSLFTTSDLRNKVVTPCFVFMEQMLYKCRVKSQGDIAYGLFLVTLVLEYTNLSKRYQPAAIAYLSGILRMAIPKKGNTTKVLPPFRSSSTAALVLKEKCSLKQFLKLEATDLIATTEITEDFKIRALYTTLKLIAEFVENFDKLPSKCEIFEKIVEYLHLIPRETYPQLIQEEITSLLDLLKKQKSERTLRRLILLEKPKALRTYEPKIRPVYDQKRHAKTPDAEKSKLIYKMKKERKGALREIRKDRRFLAGVQIKERIQSDQQRIKKVKQIYAEASVQQGELKKMERKNKRK